MVIHERFPAHFTSRRGPSPKLGQFVEGEERHGGTWPLGQRGQGSRWNGRSSADHSEALSTDLAPPGGRGLSQNSVQPGGPIWAGNGTKQGTTQLAWEAGVSPSSLVWQILITIYGMKTSRERRKEKKKKEIGKGLKRKRKKYLKIA